MEYLIKKTAAEPSLKGVWDEPAWKDANVLTVGCFLERGSDHRPKVEAKAVYTGKGLSIFFRVFDKYVRCTREDYQTSVCRDSCVEFFVKPREGRGYFNFEINCGGTMLLYYMADPTLGPEGARKQVPWEIAKTVRIFHSQPKVVYPEVEKDAEWMVEYTIPFALFEEFLGPLGSVSGQTWRANFYKCADDSSHPHWASWAPLHGKFSFHLPEYFAPVRFE
ncbi:MAG: carbohydrate-binding family 9-like protein [Verrucomicrobiae bacterium]|nr:carbohydrate-binding family 9-like protein [Verrucomicrobiae bacterium]